MSLANVPLAVGDSCPDEFFVAIQDVNPASVAALEEVEISASLHGLPTSEICSQQELGLSVRAAAVATGPWTELGPGVSAAADCGAPGVPCVGDCGWPLSSSLISSTVVGTAGGYVELKVDTSHAPGTVAVVDLHTEECIIR